MRIYSMKATFGKLEHQTLTLTPGLIAYLPVMILISIVTGLFTGFCAQFLLDRGKDLWKTISK